MFSAIGNINFISQPLLMKAANTTAIAALYVSHLMPDGIF